MSTPIPNVKKYERLKTHLLNGGDNDITTILGVLKVGSTDIAQIYIDKFKEEHAHLIVEDDSEEEQEAPAPKPAKTKSAKPAEFVPPAAQPLPVDTSPERLRYVLLDANNVMQELRMRKFSGDRVVLELPQPKFVQLIIGGKAVDYDVSKIEGKSDDYFDAAVGATAGVLRAAIGLASQ